MIADKSIQQHQQRTNKCINEKFKSSRYSSFCHPRENKENKQVSMPVPRRNKTTMHPLQETLPSIRPVKEASMQKSYEHFYISRFQVAININGKEMAVSKQSN